MKFHIIHACRKPMPVIEVRLKNKRFNKFLFFAKQEGFFLLNSPNEGRVVVAGRVTGGGGILRQLKVEEGHREGDGEEADQGEENVPGVEAVWQCKGLSK